MPNDRNHQLTYLGTFLFCLGVFLPLASIPVVGDISYYRVDNMGAIIVVLLAASAPVLIVMKKAALTFVSAIAVWVVLLWPALKNMGGGSDDSGGMLGDLMGKATDPLADFAGDLFMNINEFSWGGFVFLLGLLVLTAGCVMTTIKARK
ncbi:MAG: hypothetical protein HOJ34_02965 [Kordiimonadaceae bacterium]|jgi:hypothetical protein|nr:hypothetical protein [Kordiimonadaceae bacterium]MBT6328721.1 hypothetical protein [Kordiimonadaceae bacterium]